ncbi:MAG: bifunctional 5,10-methylenetetrahydrofolate dehydrogenase/5,10-methenyltetrahydrofolate cyclohydrolase [Patescibacteria group bacterium]
MILLDGKKISERMLDAVKGDVAGMPKKPRLAVVVVGEDPVITSFIREKKKAGERVGIDVRVYPFPADVTTSALRGRIADIVHEKENTAVIIQLPLPAHINKQYILNAIPPEKDADVLSARAVGNFSAGKSSVVPPVVGAVAELLKAYDIDWRDKHIVVLGAGMLVGKPLALWLTREHAHFTLIGADVERDVERVRGADVVISGIGKPGIVTGDMIREGAVVIDAGTSESEGKIKGDVDTETVSKKAAYLAPVPGGVGPLTVAVLMQNVVTLAKQ